MAPTVVDCERCSAELASHEPAALFGVLALDPLPDGILDRLDAGLAEQLDGVRPDGTRRRLTAWAGLAASFVLAAVLGTYVVTRGPVSPGAPSGIAQDTTAVPARGLAAAQSMELISSPGSARVLDLTVGEVDLVMIFDEALQL